MGACMQWATWRQASTENQRTLAAHLECNNEAVHLLCLCAIQLTTAVHPAPTAEYMALPASQYSVLDARKIERISDDMFK